MSNPAKAKGSQFERDCVKFFQENGFPYAERRFGAGQQKDKGDIVGIPGVAIECKNQQSLKLAQWIGEAETERENAGAKHGIVIAKRRQKPVGDSYVVMTFATFVELMEQ